MCQRFFVFFLQHYREAWDTFKKTSLDIEITDDENGQPFKLRPEDKTSERLSFLQRNSVDAD